MLRQQHQRLPSQAGKLRQLSPMQFQSQARWNQLLPLCLRVLLRAQIFQICSAATWTLSLTHQLSCRCQPVGPREMRDLSNLESHGYAVFEQ